MTTSISSEVPKTSWNGQTDKESLTDRQTNTTKYRLDFKGIFTKISAVYL